MDKKYQVFVSSTFEDLKEERKKVIEALLTKDCIPVGMEYFPAADDDQMTLIERIIEECDYFILIIGGMYGSVEKHENKSYTQLEYEYADKHNIPISAFIVNDVASLPSSRVEQQYREKLDDFTSKVKSARTCQFWSNADELACKVSWSLDKQIKLHPRLGWVKADKIASVEAYNALIKLKDENESLKKQIKFLSSSTPCGTEDYMQGEDMFCIHYEEITDLLADRGENMTCEIEKTWNDIFLSVCTLLLKPVSVSAISEHIAKKLLPKNAIIDESDFLTIITQLTALKLITTDTAKTEYDGAYTYWMLSPYGRAEMVRLKALKRTNDVLGGSR